MATFDLIGTSATFQTVLDQISMVAPVDSTVLVQGETGTGKEVVARAIHDASPRHRNRFVAINCAAIPAALLESELFGHERGAFTGAVTQTVGRFQAADRGTLFLDEIGELPLELQPKLLRVLQERQFDRVGGIHSHPVDVRVVAATNQDLERMVNERTFRADLYYRLNVFPITLPPLRERQDDIPHLLGHFIREYSHRYGKQIDVIPDAVIEDLKKYAWPGNIRELQNFVEREVVMARGTVLSPRMIPTNPREENCRPVKTLADADRAHITAVLRETNGVVSVAAARLGLPRTTLIAKMRKLGMAYGKPSERGAHRPPMTDHERTAHNFAAKDSLLRTPFSTWSDNEELAVGVAGA